MKGGTDLVLQENKVHFVKCSSPEQEVVIIGAGIAGLSAALLLQHSGARVTVLEAHDKVGGCAGYFSAGDFTFPTGATVLMGFEPEGIHRQIFEIVGAPLPEFQPIEGLKVFLPDRVIYATRDQARWRNERRKLGGNQRGQLLFWKLQELVADAGWSALTHHPGLPIQGFSDIVRNKKLVNPRLWPLLPSQVWSVGDVMRSLGIYHDLTFRTFVDLGLIITTQSGVNDAPFLNGATGLDLWRHGAFHLRGGAGELAKYMGQVFLERGGDIQFGVRAVEVSPERNGWTIVTTGGEFKAPFVAWNGGLQSLNEVAHLPASYQLRMKNSLHRGGQQWGAVNLYCGVREEIIPRDLGLHAQVLGDYSAQPGDGRDAFLSFSLPGDHSQAPSGFRTLNVSTHTYLSDWAHLDAKSYRTQKREWRDRLLKTVRIALPGFDEGSKFAICATPSTWESYTHRFDGGVGGFPLTRRNANLRAISGRIAPGLWCIGDSVFPGQGTVAAALSGFNFWRDVVS